MADQPGNIFDEGTGKPPVENKPQVPVDKYADLLKSIKNENGEQKYDSIEKALEALGHSQSFIPQLKSQLTEKETELQRISAELSQRETVEQVVQRLIANKHDGEGDPPAAKGLDEQAVMKLVQQTLQQTEQTRSVERNRNTVQEALKAKFGDKAGEAVAQKAAELGTSPKELGDLASKNPNLVLALFNTQGTKEPSITTGNIHLPPSLNKPPELTRPEKSILSGATTKDQKAFMEKVRASVYAKHGIES